MECENLGSFRRIELRPAPRGGPNRSIDPPIRNWPVCLWKDPSDNRCPATISNTPATVGLPPDFDRCPPPSASGCKAGRLGSASAQMRAGCGGSRGPSKTAAHPTTVEVGRFAPTLPQRLTCGVATPRLAGGQRGRRLREILVRARSRTTMCLPAGKRGVGATPSDVPPSVQTEGGTPCWKICALRTGRSTCLGLLGCGGNRSWIGLKRDDCGDVRVVGDVRGGDKSLVVALQFDPHRRVAHGDVLRADVGGLGLKLA